MNGWETIPAIELTAEDREKIRALSSATDLSNRSTILTYGTAAQMKPAALAEKLLEMTAEDDSYEIEGKIKSLLDAFRQCLPEERKKGLFGWLSQTLFGGRKRRRLKKKIARTVAELNTVTGLLEDHRNRLLRDHVMLGRLYDGVTEQVRELTVYIEAGENILASFNGTQSERDSFEKRLHDLRLTRTVSLQMIPQIQLLTKANTALSDRIRSFLDDTVPLWMNHMTLTLGVENMGSAAADMMEGLTTLLRTEQDSRQAKEELKSDCKQTKALCGSAT